MHLHALSYLLMPLSPKTRLRMRLLFIVAMAILLCGTPATSRAADDPIATLFTLSGAQETLRQYPKLLQAYMAANQKDTTPRVYDALQVAVRELVDPGRMDSTFLAEIRRSLSDPTAKAALTFLQSATGRAVTDAERRASTPEAVAQMETYFKEQGTESDKARVALLQVLDAATGTSEVIANINLAAQHAIALALDAARPLVERQGSDVLWALLQQKSGQARMEAQQRTMATYSFAYRSITKSELREYITFAISEPGFEYHRVLSNSLGVTVLDLNRKIGAGVARELLKQ